MRAKPTWRVLDPGYLRGDAEDFDAQYCDETNELSNFWGTIRIQPRPDMTDAARLELMRQVESFVGADRLA